MKRTSSAGVTLIETMIVLSILSSLALLTGPSVARTRREVYVAQCSSQLYQISAAIKQYRDEHHGKTPGHLRKLFPKYLNAEQLVCPFARAAAPEFTERYIARAREEQKEGQCWNSYFFFSQVGLDNLADRGELTEGFTEVWQRRGNDTPLVACFDHREPRSVNPFLRLPAHVGKLRFASGKTQEIGSQPRWEYPDQPVLVLRYDGRVDKSWNVGLTSRGVGVGTMFELANL